MRYLLVLLLAGCVNQPNYASRCENYGFTSGTPSFANCIMQLERESNAEDARAFNNGMRMMQPPPNPTVCTQSGTVVFCN